MLKLTTTKIIPNIFSQFKNIPENNWQPLNPGVEISYIYKDETTGAAAAFIRYAPGTRVKPISILATNILSFWKVSKATMNILTCKVAWQSNRPPLNMK